MIWDKDVRVYRIPYGKGSPVVFPASEWFIGTKVAFESAGLHYRTSVEAGRGVPFVSFAGGHATRNVYRPKQSPNRQGTRARLGACGRLPAPLRGVARRASVGETGVSWNWLPGSKLVQTLEHGNTGKLLIQITADPMVVPYFWPRLWLPEK